jgi:cyclase
MIPKTRVPLVLIAILISAPVWAQVDLSGEWSNIVHEDNDHRRSILMGDYTGMPINEAGRLRAESWDQAVQATPERQCIPHPVTYAMRGFPASIRIAKVDDVATGLLIAYTIHGTYGRPRTIWMDGRPHPSDLAPHTWAGFSTGTWEGNALRVTTTHIKAGFVLRNGVATSDRATMTEHYIRHGDYLLGVIVVEDPVYLAEPLIRSQDWRLNLGGGPNAYGVCGPADIVDELPNWERGYVPHYLPGSNPFLDEFSERYAIPREAASGGMDTIYPEYLRGRSRGGIGGGGAPAREGPPPSEIEVLPVQGGVYLIAGAGGNVAAEVGEDGVVLVDAGGGDSAQRVLAAVGELSEAPIRLIINTHAHPDHTGGNAVLREAGIRPGAGVLVNARTSPQAMIIAHEETLNSLVTGSDTDPAAWPTDAYAGNSKEAYLNGQGIQIFHVPGAHTDGDSIVYFRGSDVVVTGDIYRTTGYPVIDLEAGGSLSGVIEALNRVIDLAIPRDWQEGGTMVIPGHGRIADEADVVEYRDMVTIVRDRVRSMVESGMTLDEVLEARPSRDYDARYGATSGPWTTEMFIEAAYRELSLN